MSMKMTPEDLVELSAKVSLLDGVGVEVSKIRVSGHDVYLRMEGNNHVIIGISNQRDATGGGVTR